MALSRRTLAIFFFLAAFVLMLAWTYSAIAHSGSGVTLWTGRTGAPTGGDDEGTCYDSLYGCHDDFEDDTGDGWVYLNFSKDEYEENDELTITVTVDSNTTSNDWDRFGFQIVVIDEENDFVGAWNASANPRVVVEENTTLDRTYVYHNQATVNNFNSQSWSFNWTINELAGDLTFYVTGVQGGESQPFDYTYSNSYGLEQVNLPPTLTIPEVNPPDAGQESMFNFTVVYEDPDGDPVLDFVWLIIDDDDANRTEMAPSGLILNEWYVEVKGSDIGVGDDHVFRFNASDSRGAPATDEGTLNSLGPLVNDPPVLSGGGVVPQSGGEGDDYYFNVTLTDVNVGQTVLVNVSLDGTTYPMSSTDTDYTDGAEFNITIPGSTITWGSYPFIFEATDELNGFGDLDLGQSVIINDAPVLSDGAVNRTIGGYGDTFNFTVTYIDINDGQTATVTLNRTGGGSYAMATEDSDLTDGAEFYVELSGATIGWGVYSFTFWAQDEMGDQDTRDPTLGVRVNDAPALSSGGVDRPTGGYGDPFNFTVTYTDINDGQTAAVTLRVVGVGTFAMATADEDYTDGAVFYVAIPGSTIGSGVYGFTFMAEDEMAAATALDPALTVTVNDDPVLSNGGVDLANGTETDTFTFNVTYTDINAGQSATVSVRIVGAGIFPMASLDNDYTDGANFTAILPGSTIGPGLHAFTFSGVDNMSASASLDPDLTVTINDDPVLSDGMVDRASGTEGDTFTFNVTYTDINTGQTATVTLNITGVGTYPMASVDVDFTDGAYFEVALLGSTIGYGVHAFTFEAVDNMSATAELDPDLSVTVNDPPALSGGAVDRAQGILGETFNFTVTYTDANVGQEPTVWLIIVGNATNFTMNATDPSDTDYSDGNEFYIEVQVDLGDHTFYFAASDGLMTTRDPAGVTTYDGPEVGISLAELSVTSVKYYREDGTEVGGTTGRTAVKWEDTAITVVIDNTGGLTANTFNVTITINDIVQNDTSYSLAAGATLDLDFNFNFTFVGLNYINITVDPSNDTSESDETNNDLASTLTVTDFLTGLPYTITGRVIYPNGTAIDGAYVNFTNLRTGGTFSNRTNSTGDYIYVLNDGANITYNEGDRIQIVAESTVDGTLYNKTETIWVYSEDALAWVNFTVGRKAGIDLVNVSSDSIDTLPGVVVSFTVNLTNTGNFYDTFNLTNTSVQGWLVAMLNGTLPVSTISLGEGDSVILTIEVTVPAAIAESTLETVNLTVSSQFDPATTSSILLNITITQYGGVTVTAPAGNLSLPGVEIYEFLVNNTGNGDDIFDLGVTTSWVAVIKVGGVPATTVAIARDGSAVVTVELTVPVVRNGTTDLLTLTATSQFDAGELDSDNLTSTVDRFAGVTVTVQPLASQTNLTGTVVTFVFNVTNTGNEDDIFDLSVSADGAWGASVQASIAVAYGTTETVTVTVTVPDQRNGNSTTVDLTAASQFDAAANDTDSGTSIVDRYAGVTVTALAPVAQTGLQGTDLTYTFTITNDGNDDDTFDLTALSDLGWTTGVQLTVVVAYQGSEDVEVTVTVPDVQNGTTTAVTLTATSQFDAGEVDSNDVDSTVALYAGGSLDQPADDADQPGEVITYPFTVTNTGNEDETYTITVTSPGGWSLSHPATIDVAYLGSDTFDVDVTIRELPADMEDLLRVTITSGNDGGETFTRTVTSTVLQIARVTVVEPVGKYASPDELIQYVFRIINTGNADDTFDLTYTGIPAGWVDSGPATTGVIAPGALEKITVDLTLPGVALAQESDIGSLLVTATSQYNAAKFESETVDTTVLQVYDLTLVDDGTLPVQLMVGMAYPVTLTLDNLGNGADTLYLLLTGPGAGWATLDQDDIALASQAQGDVTLTVLVPDSTRIAESGRLLTVRAYTGQASQELQYTLNIDASSYGITLNDDGSLPGTIEVGVLEQVVLTLDNTGSFADDINLQLSGGGAGWASISDYSKAIAAGGSDTVTLSIRIPTGTPVTESGKALTVKAFTPHTEEQLDYTLNIDANSYGLTLGDDGALDGSLIVGDTYQAELTVVNTGSFTDTVYFQLSGEGAIWATLDSYSEQVPAGGTVTVTLTVTIPELTPLDGGRAGKDLVVRTITQHTSQQTTIPLDISFSSYGFITFFLDDQVDQNPGTTGDYDLVVNHAGSSRSRYEISTLSPPAGWSVTLAQSLVDLSSGTRTIKVDVTIPAGWTSTDPETILIVVIDQMTDQVDYADLEITVNQPLDTHNLILQGYDEIEANKNATLTINTGAGPLVLADHRFDWDMGDGTVRADREAALKYKYTRWGTYTITVTITDNRTGLAAQLSSAEFELKNLIPSKPAFPTPLGAVAQGQIYVADEGDNVRMIFSIPVLRTLETDGDITFLVINWGDGTIDYYPITLNDNGTIEAHHVYTVDDDTPYDVTTYVIDNKGVQGQTNTQTFKVKEVHNTLEFNDSLLNFLMIISIAIVGVLLVAATHHRRREPSVSSMTASSGYMSGATPATSAEGAPPVFTPGGPMELSEEERSRIERLEKRMDRMRDKEELLEVASYDASRVTTMLEEHLRKFDEIIIRAQELAAKDRLEQLQKELEIADEKQMEEDLAESEPDIERLSVAFTESLHRLVKTRDELSRIEGQLTNILKEERDEYEMELERVSQTYEETKRKIHALEELAEMRSQSQDEQTLMDLLTSEEPVGGLASKSVAEEDYGSDLGEYYSDEADDATYTDEEEYVDEDAEEAAECGNCSAEIPADAMECPECGISFEEEEEEELEE